MSETAVAAPARVRHKWDPTWVTRLESHYVDHDKTADECATLLNDEFGIALTTGAVIQKLHNAKIRKTPPRS
jgi:hypothetical protein